MRGADGVRVTVGSRSAPVPADWAAEKPGNRLRSHQLRLPPVEPAGKPGELVVFPDADPDADKLFTRWAATVVPAGRAEPKRTKVESGGRVVSRLDAAGTWKFREFPQSKKEEVRPGWRVVWVVIVEPAGATHLRLSGPAVVVEKHLPAFDRWLDSLAPSPTR